MTDSSPTQAPAVRLRAAFAGPDIVVAPGVYDALTGLIAERAGFACCYLSGASIAYTRFGLPDIGLVTMTEACDVLAALADRVSLPIVVDADNGHGNALNVQRTVRAYERAGAAALQIEDQSLPKRCGHLAGKRLVPAAEMAGKIRAACDARRADATIVIARTDAIAVEGFAAAMDRAEAYVEAGADMLFVEAPETEAQLAAVSERFAGRVPLMANMVEGGATPMQNADRLGQLGYSLVIFPGALVRHLAWSAERFFAGLRQAGSTRDFGDRMHDLGSLNALIGTPEMLASGARYDGDWEEGVSTLDPVTLAVLKGRLEQIADEMDATLFRSAFNPIIAEAHDASHGLYDRASGETLVQGKSGLPIFVGSNAFAVKAVIEHAGRSGGPAEGDTWIFNDPYLGGTHLSDFRLVRPYFRDGEVFCYLASVGHWHDVGGNVPGNYNPVATECFQEGMLIPPVKLFDRGEMRSDIVDILSANSRQPFSLYGDLNGQINALDLGARRLDALLEEYAPADVLGAFAELRARAARLMRDNIASLPDGTYAVTDHLDNDGIVDEPLTIGLDLVVRGEEMVLDFSRTSQACAGPVNIARSTTIACCYVALKHVFMDVPANAGVLEPISFVVPDDSLLAVEAPKPVGGYTETILRIIDAVFQAVAQAAPERSNAAAYGTINALSIAGHREDGRRWVMFSFFGGGHGGHPKGDGLNHGNAPISTATIPPLEILEASYPILFRQWALRPDSGGPGRHRGGLGAIYEIEVLEEKAEAFFFGERGRFAPPGVAGGEAGALNRFDYETGDGTASPPMASKMVGIRLARHRAVRIMSPGGGGYGPVIERDPEAVARDVRLGYVSAEAARERYLVAVAPDGRVDAAATAALREGAGG